MYYVLSTGLDILLLGIESSNVVYVMHIQFQYEIRHVTKLDTKIKKG